VNLAMKPRVWTVFTAYLVALGAINSAGFVVAIVAFVLAIRKTGFPTEPDPKALEELVKAALMEPWFVLASAALSALVLGGVALGGAKLSPTGLVERLRLGPSRGGARTFAVAPLTALAALAAGGVIANALELIFGRKSEVLIGLERAMRSTGPMLALTFFLIAVTTPLAEELFFRGYAQTRLVARYGRRTGILIGTGLFALFHFDPMHVVVAFAIGAVIAWTTERTGSIRVAIFAHAANNGLFVLSVQSTRTAPSWTVVAGLAVMAVGALAAIALLTREPRADPPG